MAKAGVAIVGSGNIGTDPMLKVIRGSRELVGGREDMLIDIALTLRAQHI